MQALPRVFLGRSLQYGGLRVTQGAAPVSSTAAPSHDIESDTSKSQERFGKHEAAEVAFSPTRTEDITHNYTRAGSGDSPAASATAEHVGENAEAFNCGSSVNLYAHMQSNVPEPFNAEGTSAESPTSLNMPGGGGETTSYKYLSGRRHSVK